MSHPFIQAGPSSESGTGKALADTCDLSRMYEEELPERIREFERAWADGDLTRVRSLAHQMTGAAEGYGHPSLGAAAANLEWSLSRAGVEPGAAEARYAELLRLCRRAAL